MKKILFVVDERKMGGVSTVLEDYLNNINLDNKKIDLLILHNNGDQFENIPHSINLKFIENELDVIDLPLKYLIKQFKICQIFKKICLVFSIKAGNIRKIINRIRKKYNLDDYDIEIAFKDGFCQLFTGYGNSKKKISWLHNDYSLNNFTSRYKKTFQNVLEKFDSIVAISEDIKEHFCKIYGNKEKTIVINNYIDESKIIEKSKEKLDIKIDKTKINFLCIGRLSKEKGYDRLIEAVNLLKKQYEDIDKVINIDIIGDGLEKENLSNLSKQYELDEVIHFFGRKDNPYNYIKNYDMIIIPSYYEAYCVVMIESLINKVPIFTTKVASVNEITNNGKYGKIVENSVDGIYNGIKELLDNKEKIEYYKKNLETYSYSKINAKILEKVNEILE